MSAATKCMSLGKREIELAVISGLLQGAPLRPVVELLVPSDFSHPDTKNAAEAIWNSKPNDDLYDLVAYSGSDDGLHERLGLLAEVSEAMGAPQNSLMWAQRMANGVARAQLRLHLVDALQDLECGKDANTVISSIPRSFGRQSASDQFSHAIDIALADADEAKRAADNGETIGISTSLVDVDNRTGGVLPCDLWLLVAETGGGKSALAVQTCMNAAKNGRSVGYLSLEMPQADIARRCLAAETSGGAATMGLRVGNESSVSAAYAAAPSMRGWPFRVATPGSSPEAVLAQIYRWAATGVELIVIDHLLCITHGARDQLQAQSDFMARLRDAVIQLKVPILALSQFTKEGMGERQLKHIYGGASVAWYATTILAISAVNNGDSGSVLDNVRRLSVWKCRDGRVGMIPREFHFDGPSQTFFEMGNVNR